MDDLYLEDLRIDSLVDLLKAAYSLEDWGRMIEIADKLLLSAEMVYSKQKKSIDSGKRYIYLDGKRHIVYYFGFSKLMKGTAFEKMGRYAEAQECIKFYTDLSWLDDGTEEAEKEINIFKMFAKGNSLTVSLLDGKQEYLAPYVQYIEESRIEELLPGLETILKSGIDHGFSANGVLDRFKNDIEKAIEICSKKGEAIYVAKFYYKLSIYYFKTGQYEAALHNTLKALEASGNFNDVIVFRKSVALFESLRGYAGVDQQQRYVALMSNILKEELENEKNTFISDDHIRVN
ncbi:hypothetical protein ACE3NQ_11520 [Paenibacillus terreus]|uniref:DNA-binding protein n=1 Tax=Paenibacillus terreus TaxID=1387834 RepID=A0ABV5B783_9BACL